MHTHRVISTVDVVFLTGSGPFGPDRATVAWWRGVQPPRSGVEPPHRCSLPVLGLHCCQPLGHGVPRVLVGAVMAALTAEDGGCCDRATEWHWWLLVSAHTNLGCAFIRPFD